MMLSGATARILTTGRRQSLFRFFYCYYAYVYQCLSRRE
jgi:hypothetical protein